MKANGEIVKLIVVKETISTDFAWSSEPVMFSFFYKDEQFIDIPLSAAREIHRRLGELLAV
jgi:hypothetical protein